MKFLFILVVTSLLASCGGGGGGGTDAADTTAPTITGVAVSAPSNGQLNLTASASDTKGVTGYCFKTSSTVPTAGDAWFTSDAVKSINTPDNDITYFTWAKDAAGNVSTVFPKALTDAVAPVVTGVTVSAPSNGQLTLTASASDTKGVTGYCFTTTSSTPSASDACFATDNTKFITTPVIPTRYLAWSKDAAGNVSTYFERFAGSCSAEGVNASQNSALPTVCLSTSLGEMVLALESTKAPITTGNFLQYVNDGFYSQTIFHRVISDFMIQGGGFTSTGFEKTIGLNNPIALEPTTLTGLSNRRGTIAMARTPNLNSATSQFYINVVDNVANTNNTNLDGSNGYAVFGHVISGMNTVDAIRYTPATGTVPNVLPVINWAYQLK